MGCVPPRILSRLQERARSVRADTVRPCINICEWGIPPHTAPLLFRHSSDILGNNLIMRSGECAMKRLLFHMLALCLLLAGCAPSKSPHGLDAARIQADTEYLCQIGRAHV